MHILRPGSIKVPWTVIVTKARKLILNRHLVCLCDSLCHVVGPALGWVHHCHISQWGGGQVAVTPHLKFVVMLV